VRVDSKFSIPEPTQNFLVGYLDGDGIDDVFMATGAAWYYSSRGNAEWQFLNAKIETADTLLIGDFDGDGVADVFTQIGDNWMVSWGGRSEWQLLSSNHRANLTIPDRGMVDYVGDKRSDVFLCGWNKLVGIRWRRRAVYPLCQCKFQARQLVFRRL